MCIILSKTERKSYTGFKIVHKVDGKYYSPATGIEYKPGPVTPTKTIIESKVSGGWNLTSLTEGDRFYNKNMYGKTSVFVDKRNADLCYGGRSGESVVEMTISGGIWEGGLRCSYNPYTAKLFLGTKIVSIKEL
ncbi:MAG: hypothetical protein ABIH82_05240 [Candidatus Woesearchaeota archaeon]